MPKKCKPIKFVDYRLLTRGLCFIIPMWIKILYTYPLLKNSFSFYHHDTNTEEPNVSSHEPRLYITNQAK